MISVVQSLRMSKISAACIIIGDEVLNGKIIDTNSRFFAKYCFNLGIKLKEIITIGDDEDQIVETVSKLSKKYHFIITTGGIGSTHDDITYAAISKSFGLPCVLNEELKKRMQEKQNPESRLDKQALKDYYKMATLPSGSNVKNYYVSDDLWVPICSINQQVFIFPGIPQLFEKMLTFFTPILKDLFHLTTDRNEYVRYFVKTKLTESQISHRLKLYQEQSEKISPEIKIGSYPHYGMGFNTISILGEKKHDNFLRSIVDRAIIELEGEKISSELEDSYSNNRILN
ncbi:flavin adenine dinucleotide pyrophosphatase PWA37_003338 [Arxiozyma heterogenica]|uniref:MoaB/Mog domain-containing protein n=1 Tax=Arxiozyma heterogenica TaxID=278026 RepID=A0AAN7WPM8_9SACH|nr:hypothetical protein RI543_001809 [Kazachstania heterogenica]